MIERKEEILGYTKIPDGSWEPISPCKKGYIYTSSMITCCQCNRFIRDMGGPIENSLCINCYNSISLE